MVQEVPLSTIRGIEKVFQTHFNLANLWSLLDVARRGGNVAKTAREQLEKELGHPVISPDNAKSLANTDLPELDLEK